MQDYGNGLRERGINLSSEVDKKIKDGQDYILDSLKNPCEIDFFRKKYPFDFVLVGIFANSDIRWNRIYRRNKNAYGSRDIFDAEDKRDHGDGEPPHGQKISDCFFESDLIISNEEKLSIKTRKYNDKKRSISDSLNAFKEPIESFPKINERLMADAYTTGRSSTCSKRRVGAVITDKNKRIISSGYNHVPTGSKDCIDICEELNCYRDEKKREVSNVIYNDLSQHKLDMPIEDFENIISKNFKMLDYCRALHAEENAIVSLVGNGVNMDDSWIFVTTHPCNLCANKIVQCGIKHVVYFEPYPVKEAQQILKDANVELIPFEGVTFRAFFRAYNYRSS